MQSEVELHYKAEQFAMILSGFLGDSLVSYSLSYIHTPFMCRSTAVVFFWFRGYQENVLLHHFDSSKFELKYCFDFELRF